MTITVNGPNGVTINFPEGTDSATIDRVMAEAITGKAPADGAGRFANANMAKTVDAYRPTSDVRAEIASLPEGERPAAMQKWAASRVGRERAEAGVADAIATPKSFMQRGTFIGPFLDEIKAGVAGALNKAGLSPVGYDEVMALEKARNDAADEANPVASPLLKLMGGVMGFGAGSKLLQAPGAIAKGTGVILGGPLAAMGPSSNMLVNIGKGAGSGALYGGTAAFGEADGTVDDRLAKSETGAWIGGGLGAVLPPVLSGAGKVIEGASNVISPQLARAGGAIRGAVDDLRIKASAGGQPATGSDAAAEQIIANQLARANVNVPMLRQRLADADEAARVGGGTQSSILGLVDLDPSLQRLAGTVARKQPEAANMGQAFVYGRQTGETPTLPMPQNAGVPTRAAFTANPDGRPMGQFERVTDGLKRALGINDSKALGHEATGFQTEQAILRRAREEADPMYRAAYQAAGNADLTPTIQSVTAQAREMIIDEAPRTARLMERMARDFERVVAEGGRRSHLERFDRVKQEWDGEIEKLFSSTEGRNRYIAGALNRLRNTYIDAVESSLPGDAGARYRAARDAFSSNMEARDALRLGRSVFKADSDVGLDRWQQITAPGLQNLFKLGLYESFVNNLGKSKRTADITQIFETPRVQELLREIISAPGQPGARTAEQFGRGLASEKMMVGTRNEVFGNSKTQQRAVDDREYEAMQSLFDQARSLAVNPSTTNFIIKGAESVLNRLFGMRADTAASVAQKLFTADPVQRERILAALEKRVGPNRAAQLANIMREYRAQAAGQAASQAGRETQ